MKPSKGIATLQNKRLCFFYVFQIPATASNLITLHTVSKENCFVNQASGRQGISRADATSGRKL